jgi:hypothetical protein
VGVERPTNNGSKVVTFIRAQLCGVDSKIIDDTYDTRSTATGSKDGSLLDSSFAMCGPLSMASVA